MKYFHPCSMCFMYHDLWFKLLQTTCSYIPIQLINITMLQPLSRSVSILLLPGDVGVIIFAGQAHKDNKKWTTMAMLQLEGKKQSTIDADAVPR